MAKKIKLPSPLDERSKTLQSLKSLIYLSSSGYLWY